MMSGSLKFVILFLAGLAMVRATRVTSECSRPSEWKLLLQDVFRDEENSEDSSPAALIYNLRFMLLSYFRDSSIICLTGRTHLEEVCNKNDYSAGAPDLWIFSKQYSFPTRRNNARNYTSTLLAAFENFNQYGNFLETIFNNFNDNFMRRRNAYLIKGTAEILNVIRKLLRKNVCESQFENVMRHTRSIEIPDSIKCRNLTAIEKEKQFAIAVRDAVKNAHLLLFALRGFPVDSSATCV